MLRLAALVAVIALTVVGSPLVASAQAPSLNWGSHVNPSRCPTDQGYRYQEINVTRKVDGDLAFPNAVPISGAEWAVRDFNQHIQVWQVGVVEPPTGGERFCALVRYQGSFMTIDGAATPGDSDTTLAGGIDGSFEGGYLLVFNADERTSPDFKTHGHIGTFQGPIDLYDWLQYYFTNVSIDPTEPRWWGWVYHGGNNGAWVNATGGVNQGDITN